MSKKKVIKENGTIVVDTYNRWFNAALIAICFLLLLAVRLQTNQNTTGDEPYYLLADYSMVHDRDLSLANNYKDKNYLGFYNNPILDEQGTANVAPKYVAKAYSSHGNGLPLFILPGFFLAEKTGAVFEMILLSVGVVYLTWFRTKQVTKNRKVAYLAAGALAICYFFNGLVGVIYPDMLMAAITMVVLIILDEPYKKPWFQFLLGFALGFLILVHFKSIIIVAPAMLILTYKSWRAERRIPWVSIAIVGLFTAYYFLTLYQWFGVWNLSAIQGGQPFNSNPLRNIPAMLFDSSRGLFIYNPITLLIVVGLPIWFKVHRRSLIETALVVGPTIASLCIIPNWNGSAAPTGRYIIEFLPALVPAIGFALIALTKVWQKVFVGILAFLTFLITLDATMMRFPYINGGLFINQPLLFSQIKAHTGLALDRLLPVYSNETTLIGQKGILKVGVWSLLVLVLFWYGWYLGYRKKKLLVNWLS